MLLQKSPFTSILKQLKYLGKVIAMEGEPLWLNLRGVLLQKSPFTSNLKLFKYLGKAVVVEGKVPLPIKAHIKKK